MYYRRAVLPPSSSRRSSVYRCYLLIGFALVVALLVMAISVNIRVLSTNDSPHRHVRLAENEEDALQESQPRVSFVYSIGSCTGHSNGEWQELQATVLDYTFRKVRQSGRLIRLVSGCGRKPMEINKKGTEVRYYGRNDVVVGASRADRVYVQANRPFAFREFLLEVGGSDDEIYAMLDPDFVFRARIPLNPIRALITERNGTVVASRYSLQMSFYDSHALKMCLETFPPERCRGVEALAKQWGGRGFDSLGVGVPYFMTRRDWLRVLDSWIALIPHGLRYYDGIESDMYSFGVACAVEGIRVVPKVYMSTCMSTESVSEEFEKSPILHLCQRYYVRETRERDDYRVTPLKEIKSPRDFSFDAFYARPPEERAKDVYLFVFNKHWLKNSCALCCTQDREWWQLLEPPLPPAVSHESELKEIYGARGARGYEWHETVVDEAVRAYNEAIVDWLRGDCPYLPRQDEAAWGRAKRLIMHEMHGGRKEAAGRLNHPVEPDE